MKPVRFAPGLRPLLIAVLLVCLPVAAQNLSSVSLSPTSIVGGVTPAPTGTVTLSANAPAGGKVVTLSSGNTGAATVPTSVTVASGTKTKTFSVTTTPQPANASAVITAVLGTVTKTATLTVKAPAMSAATVSPTSVKGGIGATLTVTLTGNAPVGGTAVALTSSNALAAVLPATVTVLAGTKTVTAPVTTLGVDANATVTLTATAGGVAKTASLTVSKPVLTTLSISPATIPGGGAATGTLTFTGSAGPSGVSVTLSSNKTNVATVPASRLIVAGQSTATFPVTGTSLPAGGTATITATWSGVSKTANVTLQPSAALQAVGLAESSIRGGQPVAGTVTLSASAPSGGVVVNLTSSDAAATVPATVTVPQGQTTTGFTLTTSGVGSATPVTITGISSGISKTAPLTVEPAVLTALTISPESIPGGTAATGTLTLDGPAGPSGATINLISNDANVATVPASTLIAAGQATGTFTITGAAVTDDAVTTISATLASESHSADITVTRTIGSLTGTVKDASTGFFLPSAHVVLTADPAWETWTDGDGQYQLGDVPAGLHTVEVSYEGFSSATSSAVTVTNGLSVTVPPVSLTPDPGTISGTILDRDNGDQPLAGALVTDATGRHTATTDGNGHYELTGLAPGFTYLVIHRSGYRPAATGELSVDAGSLSEANVTVSPVSEEDRPGKTEGVVRDIAGVPVSGATVSVVGVPGVSATTGQDGSYSLDVPAAEAFLLEVEKPGYGRALSRNLRASTGSRPFHVAHDLTLPLADATGTIELRTFDPVSRNPFRSDLWFRTPEGLWHAPVSDSGIRTITGVPAGLVWGCAGPLLLSAGATVTMSCPGEPVVPEGSPRWAAAGVVINRYTAEPIADATATFVNGSTVVAATSDANGLFSTHSGPEGEYSVTVAAEGFLQTEPWVFTAADDQENGSCHFAWLWPEMPGGSVSVTAPEEGAVLAASPIQIALSLVPARPGDQLLWAWAWPSAGNVTSVTPVYSADGMSAVITIEGTFPNGPLTIGVEAATQTGAGLTAQRNLTVDLPTHPTSLSVSPSTVPGGSIATGTVTVDPPAPAGGAFVSLSSSSPSVTVPSSVPIAAGETSGSFEIVATAVVAQTVATITASVGAFTASATLTVNPTMPPPVVSDLAEGDLSGWQGFADPPYSATVTLDTTRVKIGSASLRFVTDSGFDSGVRYVVPGGAHWDLRGVRFLTFWSYGDNFEAFQGVQPVVILRGPGGSIRFQPPDVQTVNGGWTFHRVSLGDTSDWIVTTEGEPSLGDITSFEIHQDVWGMGMTVFYDGVAFVSDIPEDLAEGTAALWGTFASDGAAATVVDDASDARSGSSALRFDTASGFDTGLVFPKAGAGQPHWDLSDVRTVTAWIRAEHVESFQGNYPVLVLRSPSGLVRYEPGDVLLNTPGWRFYEIPLDGAFPWTRTQEGTPDLADVTAIEIHGDIWGSGFRLYVDGVSVGRPLPLLSLSSASAPEGSTVTATVFLSDVAPAGGRTVLVSSSDPAIASVPASVVVPAGQRSTTFAVTAGSLTLGTPVTIAVADRGFSVRTSLRVDPIVDVTSVSLGVPSVLGGTSVAGTVTIEAPAGAGGVAVLLVSSNPEVASVPSALLVPEGAAIAPFTVTTFAVASSTPVSISADAGGVPATATLTVTPPVVSTSPPLATDLAEGDISGWQGLAEPPYAATVSLETTRIRVGSSSLKFVTDSGFDSGVRYTVPGGAHWDLRGVRFLTFWSYGDNTEAYQGAQPVVILRGPGGSIRLQPPAVQTFNGEWRLHRVPLGQASDWIVTTEGTPSLGDISSFEIHQDIEGMGMTVFYDGVAFVSDIPEDLAEGTAALWGTFASDNQASSVVDDGSDVRSGVLALRFDTASGFDTGLVFPKAGAGQAHWDLSDVRSVTAWIRAEHVESFQGNYPVLVLRSPSGLVRYEPGDVLLNTPGWRFYEVPLDGAFPWTRTQEGTPDLADVTAIEIHGDIEGYGFQLQVDGVSVGRPLPLVKLPSASTPGGSTVTASVSLSDAAPEGGRVVLLSSSDSGVASVPPSIVVPAGARSTTFPVTTNSVTTGTPVSITVSDRGFSARTDLRVDPVVDVTSLALGTTSTIGGLSVAGTITISAPAWSGGTAVTLSSSNPGVASVPAIVTVPAGGTATSFSVTTGAVGSDTAVSISANAGAATATASLTVVSAPLPELSAISITPATVLSGANPRLTISLTAPAPIGGAVVALTAFPAGLVSFPSAVTVAAGTATAEATVNVPASTDPVTVTLTATVGSSVRNAELNVSPPAGLLSVSAVPGAVTAGGSISVSASLVSAAPSGGKTILLACSVPDALVVPATMLIPEGASTASIPATAPASAPEAAVTITAADGAIQKSAAVAVHPLARISALSFAASGAFPGESVAGTLSLTAAAPVGGYSLALVSSLPGVISVPASVVVPAGELSTTVQAVVAADGPGGVATVSASQHGVTKQATVAGVTFLTLSTSPSVAVPGQAVKLRVLLSAPVPADRSVELTLSSSAPAIAAVPATVTIAAGQILSEVPVTRVEVLADSPVDFTASALGSLRTAHLVLEPLKVRSVSPRWGRTSIPACGDDSLSMSLNAPAPSGGALIDVTVTGGTSTDGVPASGSSLQHRRITVPAGSTSENINVHAVWTPVPSTLILTARLGASEASGSLSIVPGTSWLNANPARPARGASLDLRLSFSGDGLCVSRADIDAEITSSDPSVLPVTSPTRFEPSEHFGFDVTEWRALLPVPVTASSGTTRITVTAHGVSAWVDITVPESSLAAFSINPSAAPAGAEVTGVVTLDAPAPPDGVTVLFGSSDPSKVTLPASVGILAGTSSVTLAVTPHDTATGADSVITATLGTGSRTVTFRALPSNAASIVGRVVDSADYDVEAPVSGATVFLSPGPGQFVTGADGSFRLHAEPGTSTVRSEALGFIAYTTNALPLAESQNVDLGTIRARRPGGGACTLHGWVLDPQGSPVHGANGVLEGYDVSLRTDGAGSYEVALPSPLRRYRMTFSKPGYPTWTEDVTPSVLGLQCLSGNPLSDFILDPNPRPSVIDGSFLTPTMLSGRTARLAAILSGPAPSGGAKVSVTQVTPGSYYRTFDQLRIPQGQTGAGLYADIYLPNVTEPTTVEYALFYGGVTKKTSIQVVPETVSISCPNNLTGTTTRECNLSLLLGPAPSGGAVVPLTSSSAEFFSVPTSVTVLQGQTSVTFPVTIGRFFGHSLSATLKGLWAGGWGERSISAFRPDVISIVVSPAAVVGGAGATGTVTLGGPAYPTGQTTVALESAIPAIIIPATVTVASGESTATFPIATTAVTQPISGTILGRLTMLSGATITGAEQRGTSVLVTPSGLGLACTPTELVGGSPASCVVSLPGSPAPAGGTAITLTSMSGVVSVPASVTVPQGSYSRTFTATTSAVAATTAGFVRATLEEGVAEVPLTVLPATLKQLDLKYGNEPVEGGFATEGRVTLEGPAPAGGIVVALSMAGASAIASSSVLIPEGATSVWFPISTVPVTANTTAVLTASHGSVTLTQTLNVAPQTWLLSGLAPGRVLAGAGDITLYGREFLATNLLRVAGPVYTLGAPDTAVCDEPAGTCPGFEVPGLVSVPQGSESTDRITFTVPASLSPGYYAVRARSAAGALSSDVEWLLLQDPTPSRAAVPPEQHDVAWPITSGQTVTGTFVENGDLSGSTNDFNLYYFVAAAGARISVRLERADASFPWEHPDSLDPQVALVAPDGFVYENEGRQDVVRATDLNAEVTDLTLPQTGMWLIAASTSRGHGDYRLSYTMTAPGSVPLAQRIVAFTGRGATAPVGADVRLTVAAMDPRGHLVSGARVSFAPSYPSGSLGQIAWVDPQSPSTAVDGLAQTRIRSTTAGVVDFRPSIIDSGGILTGLAAESSSGVRSKGETEAAAQLAQALSSLPRYQAVEHHPYVVRDVDADGNVSLDLGPVRTLEIAQPSRLRTVWETGARGPKTLDARPSPGLQSEPSSSPRPLPAAEAVVAPACSELQFFRFLGVTVPEVKAPFTVSLEDLTPRHGEDTAPGLVGERGIEGHRIEKTIRLRISVKDRDGQTPAHPVLLHFSLSGPRAGTLIFDPEGAGRRECREGFVVWHDVDANGTPIPNDLLDYRLGTLSLIPGFEPDPDHSGHVKPVWGAAEAIDATAEAVTTESTVLSQKTFLVRPLPGKPSGLVDWDGPPEDDRWEYWNGFGTSYDSEVRARAVIFSNYNAYTLVDKYGNTVWGYGDTTTRLSASRLTVQLLDQATTGPDFRGYRLRLKWWADGSDQMPRGLFPVDLVVRYPQDPDWGGGEVVAATTVELQGGSQTHLKSYDSYENRFGVDDGAFPMSVPPEAKGAAIAQATPSAFPGAPARTIASARRLALVLLTGTEAPALLEVSRAPHHQWDWTGTAWVERQTVPLPDPHIDVSARPRLRLKLIDVYGNVQTAAGFKVHLCPRFDHEGSPAAPEWACPTAPVESTNGEIAALAMNPGVVGNGDPPSPDATGYIGLELTQAPTAPGTYYVYVESLDKDVKIRDQSQLHLDDTPEGQYQGGFALCTVTGAEILDQNFQRVDVLPVNGPTPAYVRYVQPSSGPSEIPLHLTTRDSSNTPITSMMPVTVSRVGSQTSGVYLGPFSLQPRDGGVPAQRQVLAAEGPITLTDYVKSFVEVIRDGLGIGKQDTRTAADLQIEWLDDADQRTPLPTTRVVPVADPDVPGHSLWVEETRFRILAVGAGDRIKVGKLSGAVVRVDEQPNLDFRADDGTPTTPSWRYSYQGDLGVATDLQPTRERPGDYTAITLTDGASEPIVLRSVAGPRSVVGEDLEYAREQWWDSHLLICQVRPGQPTCLSTDPADVSVRRTNGDVRQWVDLGRYGGGGNDWSRPFEGGDVAYLNGIRDWTEAMFANALSRTAAKGGFFTEAAGCPQRLSEEATFTSGYQKPLALVRSTAPGTIVLKPLNWGLDEYRWDRLASQSFSPFALKGTTTFAAVAIHEARHCWQLGQPSLLDLDTLPADPTDPQAIRLRDQPHFSLLPFPDLQREGNPEVSLLGDQATDPFLSESPFGTAVQVLRERDAYAFQVRATADWSTANVFEGGLRAVSVSPSSSMTLSTQDADGQLVLVSVRAEGPSGVLVPALWISVELEIVGGPDGGLRVSPEDQMSAGVGRRWVLSTGLTGEARARLIGQVSGSYEVRLTVREITALGTSVGAPVGGQSSVIAVVVQ